MDAITDPRLIALTGMLGVWLIYAWMMIRRQRALPPARGETRWFHLSSGLWWTGPLILLGGPSVVFFAFLLLPPMGKDVVPVVFLTLFMGGLAPVAGVALMRTRYRLDDSGLVGYSAWGMPVFVAWHAVRGVTFNSAIQTLRFSGGPVPVHVLVQIHEWPAFVTEIERRLPHLTLPGELQPDSHLRNDGERLAFEGHWQGAYDIAGPVFAVSLLTVAASMAFLAPYAPAWALAAFGGACMAAFPILRRLVPKPRKYAAALGDLLQGVGFIMGMLLMNVAYQHHTRHLGGEDAIDGALWLGMFLPLPLALTPELLPLLDRIIRQVADWPHSSLSCPRCGRPMHVAHFDGVEIDLCRHCRSVWLDKGEADGITASRPKDEAQEQAKDEATHATLCRRNFA